MGRTGARRRGLLASRRSRRAHPVDRELGELRRIALEHEEAGRVREALVAWTRLNQLGGDPEVEAHLLEVRCDPRLTTPTGTGVDPWPRQLEDPFPGLVGQVPEVPAADLSMEVLGGAILHHGSLLVRGLLSDHQAESLRVVVDRAFAAREALAQGAPVAQTAPWFQPCAPWDRATPSKAKASRRFSAAGGSSLHLCDSPRGFFKVMDALATTRVVDVVSDYLGEPAVLSAPKTMLRRVSPEASPSWHQDGSFMGVHSRVVNLWISLSHCGDGCDAPGISILPRRVDWSLHGEVSDGNIILSPTELEEAGAGVGATRPTFGPGDALLFDELMAHANGGGQPGLTQHRYAIESWMFAPTFMPGEYLPIAIR